MLHSFVEAELVVGLRSGEFWVHLLAYDVKLAQKSTPEALQLCLFSHVIRYSAGRVFKGWASWVWMQY